MPVNSSITIHANGKLLISGEYFVLNGSLALALPTKFGQRFTFTQNQEDHIYWNSYDFNNGLWLEVILDLPTLKIKSTNNQDGAARLQEIMRVIHKKNNTLFDQGWVINSYLEFPGDWGLGSSSTLIYAVAKWANMDPYELLEKTFGGSGYDIACAGTDLPIIYQRINGKAVVQSINFSPNFNENLYFVHLGKKQNSREGIKRYRTLIDNPKSYVDSINELTMKICKAESLDDFEQHLTSHEKLIGSAIQLQPVKELHFKEYWGAIKSLGAWGGDFVLATSEETKEKTIGYFKEKGYNVVLTYKEMIMKL